MPRFAFLLPTPYKTGFCPKTGEECPTACETLYSPNSWIVFPWQKEIKLVIKFSFVIWRKVTFHIVPSCLNADSGEFGSGVSINYQSFLSQGQLLSSYLSHLCLENLPWLSACLGHAGCCFLHVQAAQLSVRGPQNMARQKCGLHCTCGQCPIDCCQLLGEMSVFLLAVFGSGSGSGRVVSSAPSLGKPVSSMGPFNTARNFYYLYSWNLTRYLQGLLFFFLVAL